MNICIYCWFFIFIFISCSSASLESKADDGNGNNSNEKEIVYPVSELNNYSSINKKTSWYRTNKSFDQLFDVPASRYRGFEKDNNGDINGNKIYWKNESGKFKRTITN